MKRRVALALVAPPKPTRKATQSLYARKAPPLLELLVTEDLNKNPSDKNRIKTNGATYMEPRLLPEIDERLDALEEGAPERNLIASVIYRALNDLLEPNHCNSAMGWFEYSGKPNKQSLQFKQCCDYLGWDWRPVYKKAKELNQWIQQRREGQTKVQRLMKIPLKSSPLAPLTTYLKTRL